MYCRKLLDCTLIVSVTSLLDTMNNVRWCVKNGFSSGTYQWCLFASHLQKIFRTITQSASFILNFKLRSLKVYARKEKYVHQILQNVEMEAVSKVYRITQKFFNAEVLTKLYIGWGIQSSTLIWKYYIVVFLNYFTVILMEI